MAETPYTDNSIERIRNIHHGNFFDYLSSAYEVLRKIFSYLSLEELDVVAEAVDKWRPIVETTRKERASIDSYVFSYTHGEYKIWSEAKFSISFFMEEDNDLEKKLRKHLTENNEFLTIESRAGVIGSSTETHKVVEQRMLRYGEPAKNTILATHLRIPNFPDVGIKTFVWRQDITFEQFNNDFSLPDNKTIKCLLILMTFQETNRKACEQKDSFVTFLQNSQTESFAVGGCLIDSFIGDPEAISKYIVFYGDKVEAASLVLTQEIQSKESINSKVKELKSICPNTKKGVLFAFRCCSRHEFSRQVKIRKNLIKWEGEALDKYFSSTPVIGCYGYGEFGKKFPTDEENSVNLNKRPKKVDIWEYSFSTSLVYIGFN